MNPDAQFDQLSLVGTVLQGAYIVVIFVPYLAAILLTKNRKLWLWWYKKNWLATFFVCLTLVFLKVIAFSVLPKYVNLDEMGGPDAIKGLLLTYGVLETYPVISLIAFVHKLVPSYVYHGISLDYYIFDFIVLFALFSLLRMVKAHLAKKAFELE